MSLDFFKQAVYLQNWFSRVQIISNSLQTYGLLLDKKCAQYFGENNFLLGLSLDGPQRTHDRYRKHKNSQGSWLNVVERAKLLLDFGVETNVSVMVNNYFSLFPEEIYGFPKE